MGVCRKLEVLQNSESADIFIMLFVESIGEGWRPLIRCFFFVLQVKMKAVYHP